MKYLGFYGVLFDCPFGRRKVSCDLFTLEHMSFEEKYKWFENLSADKKDALVERHQKCLEEREFNI